jgi:hypothetical protein
MTYANEVYNRSIQCGAERHMLRHIYLRADNFFNDEARNRVIFQFDCDWSAITVCTKTWKIKPVKHFNSLVIASTFGKKFDHHPLSIQDERRISVKEYVNYVYGQEFRDVKYRALHDLNHPRNRDFIDRLGEARYEVKRYAALLLQSNGITGLHLIYLKRKYNKFIEIGKEMRKNTLF